eukprot:scaffold12252_cov37-Attheya_sp.AAC.2
MRGCEWVELRCRGHGRLWESLNMVSSLDIHGDVQDMACCEGLLDMVGSYIRNQDVKGMGK